MDYSLIPTEQGILVKMNGMWLNSSINLTRGKAKAHPFRDEIQARRALKTWVVS